MEWWRGSRSLILLLLCFSSAMAQTALRRTRLTSRHASDVSLPLTLATAYTTSFSSNSSIDHDRCTSHRVSASRTTGGPFRLLSKIKRKSQSIEVSCLFAPITLAWFSRPNDNDLTNKCNSPSYPQRGPCGCCNQWVTHSDPIPARPTGHCQQLSRRQ